MFTPFPDATKAGARHSATDNAIIAFMAGAIKDHAASMIDSLKQLGYTEAEAIAEIEAATEDAVKSMELPAIKALDYQERIDLVVDAIADVLDELHIVEEADGMQEFSLPERRIVMSMMKSAAKCEDEEADEPEIYVYDDYAILCLDDADYRIPYTLDGVTVTLAPTSEWRRVTWTTEEEEGTFDEAETKAERYGGTPRADLKDSDFVFPDTRTFPVMTQKDVEDAVSSWGRYKGEETFETFKTRLTALAKRKGFAEALPASWGATKAIKALTRDDGDAVLVYDGDGVKAMPELGAGWVGGYLVRFGDPATDQGDLSEYRDIFTRDTDYGNAKTSTVWTHHRMLPGYGKARLTNDALLEMTDAGVFVKHLLNMRDDYERRLYAAAAAGKLGWSSGTAPHLVERKSLGDGRHQVMLWPLGLDASYTPIPAGGFSTTTSALKTMQELGLTDAPDDAPLTDAERSRSDEAKRMAAKALAAQALATFALA